MMVIPAAMAGVRATPIPPTRPSDRQGHEQTVIPLTHVVNGANQIDAGLQGR